MAGSAECERADDPFLNGVCAWGGKVAAGRRRGRAGKGSRPRGFHGVRDWERAHVAVGRGEKAGSGMRRREEEGKNGGRRVRSGGRQERNFRLKS